MQPNPSIREDSYLSTLYFAYGANLNRISMRARCPAAIPCGAYRLEGFRLVFRTVADIEPAPGEAVHGVLWRITPECLRSLDVFEGYPDVYDHRFLTLEDGGDALYYKMNTTGYAIPRSATTRPCARATRILGCRPSGSQTPTRSARRAREECGRDARRVHKPGHGSRPH